MMPCSTLVSVAVCSYNSSTTVIDTLESIKSQTYQNLELIISDDDSKDNTVQICENWIEENKNRFYRTQIITHSPNSGISANLNRAFTATEGEWIKIIAADDKLLPNCIWDYMDYTSNHQDSSIIFSIVVGFGNMEAANKWPWSNVKRIFDSFCTRQFRVILSTQNFLPAASAFLRRSVWQNIGGFDESIPLIEDYPFWIKALSKGYHLDFLDKETVGYRFGEQSVSQGITPLSDRYVDSSRKACVYAYRSLKDINIFYDYLFLTRRLYRWKSPVIDKLVWLLNLLNPAYYEYYRTLGEFKRMSGTKE